MKFGCRIENMKYLYLSIFASFIALPLFTFAHQSGCHRWHSCPSDSGSYTCGDLGYPCNYPTYSSSGSSYTPSYNYYSAPSTPSCPSNSYASGSSCKCFSGYVADGNKCISYDTYCSNEHGLMSTYSYLTDSCTCLSGYEMNSFGTCTYKSSYSSSYSSYGSYYEEASCPAHSTRGDDGSCYCKVGYKTNAAKSKCVKITKKENDKLCKADFGKNSEWSKKYDTETETPTCQCKKKFVWSADGESCVKG